MEFLLLGLLVFLGTHSVRIVAEGWRSQKVQAWGAERWKGLFSLASALGLALTVWGYGQARLHPVLVWLPPVGLRHLASLLTMVAFVLLAAAYVPGNLIKTRLRHPMILGVKVWALAHLLANGMLAQMVLFGTFLLWSVLDYPAARQRDRQSLAPAPAGTAGATGITVAVGVAAWVAFVFWLHGWLMGVRPMG